MGIFKRVIRQCVYGFFLLAFNSFIISAQTPAAREYQIKAVFIFNFTQFVEWPPSCFATDQSPLIIGVYGENPFGSYLEKIVSGEKVNGHPLVVQYYKNLDDIKSCHILFINSDETNKRKEAVATLKGRNVLTVSDAPDFLNEEGMVKFFTRNNKMQLQINLEMAKAEKLGISSKLLRLAEIHPSKN